MTAPGGGIGSTSPERATYKSDYQYITDTSPAHLNPKIKRASRRFPLSEETKAPPIPAEAVFLLTHPALTGISRERFDRLVEELEPCRRLPAEAERLKNNGINRRGYNPGVGYLDHRHRVLVALLHRRNTVTLTLVGHLVGRPPTSLNYHAHRTEPLLAFAGPDITTILATRRRTRPPRTVEALTRVIDEYDHSQTWQ
jgi:hypothetical protein